jgi:excisionase family DNA binding protein
LSFKQIRPSTQQPRSVVVAATSSDDLPSRIEREPGALSAPKLATYLGLSRSAIYERAQDGRIPHFRLGNIIRFDPATIAAWLRDKEIKAA